MPNKKVHPSKKKKVVTFSVQTRVAEKFKYYCGKNDINASAVVESLICDYLKSQL